MTFVSKSKQSYSCVKVLQDHFKSTKFFSDKCILFYWESQRLMKEMNVKLNGYICASHNLKLDVRIILSYNFTVIKKSTHRSMPTHILKIHTSKYATKNPQKTLKKPFTTCFLNHTKILQNLHSLLMAEYYRYMNMLITAILLYYCTAIVKLCVHVKKKQKHLIRNFSSIS